MAGRLLRSGSDGQTLATRPDDLALVVSTAGLRRLRVRSNITPNKSFKPNLLRYSNGVAEKACHAVASTAQVGLTQALGLMQTDQRLWGNRHPILFFLVVLPLLTVVALIAKPFLLLFSKPVVRSASEVASIIEAFLKDTGGSYDWDDFICGGSIANKDLEAIRARCASLPDEFPPASSSHYCSEAGFEVMRGLAARLRATSEA